MRQGIRPVKLPRVNRVGRYRYHRVTGARLPALPETHPDFVAAWAAEDAKGAPQRTRGKPGSIAATCGAYLKSEQYLGLSSAYRRIIRRNIDEISEKYGDAPMSGVLDRHIESDLAKLKPHPSRQRLKAWRQLCTWAKDAGLIKRDPSIAIKAKRAPKTEGHVAWTKDDIAKVREKWPIDSPRRLAVELAFWTGCRISDLVTLNRGMVGSDGVLTFRQAKTGGLAHVPWSCALPAFADVETHRHLMACIEAQGGAMLYLTTAAGKPRSAKAVDNWIAESAREAGLTGRSAHGLRKARLTDLAERGAPALAMMSWGGHETLSEVQHYIEAANRKRSIYGVEQEQNMQKARS
ncbi:tyrosine-type recombinase/integrase [Acidimangrovimonas sediminis]|uniref:tyrosine-type recombinase/integrase n=1 Tax=Acidimangrovimonas sediminis TaxID=2056283 RepID=UPI001304BB3A|nr:tyrosine-type recombinase/integrase [Acidimangrovimonas sediminis]